MKLPPENTILLVEVGSTAHGTGIDGMEDHDELAVVIESPEEVIVIGQSLRNKMERSKPEGVRSEAGDTDRQVYSLRKFVDLALQGNPSILLALWAPVISSTQLGSELRELGPKFVGRHIIPKFQGYMQGQALRLIGLKGGGHGKRGGGGREELIAEHGYDTKYAMHCTRLGYQCLELLVTKNLNLPIPGSTGEHLRQIRYGKVSFQNWFDHAVSLYNQLESYKSVEDIQINPNREHINQWLVEAHLYDWRRGFYFG